MIWEYTWVELKKSKFYKALKGSHSPFSSDDTNIGDDEDIRLPSAIGVGAVPQFFNGPALSGKRKDFHDHWLKIYHQEQLYNAGYMNLYDMYYDKPETYVFRKASGNKEITYYSFFADKAHFDGEIELRGLKANLTYTVIDYPNAKVLGKIQGNKPLLHISFDDYFLIKCIPE